MMLVSRCPAAAICGGLLLIASPTRAQSAPTVAFDAVTDARERGLGWSAGKLALEAEASITVADGLSLDASALTLRDSARHGGADLGLTASPRYSLTSGGWDFGLGAKAHVFVGRSGLSYGEATADVSRTIGPARLSIGGAFAPAQNAIGGSNLYLDAQASISLPGTPVTLYGGAGRTSGTKRDDPRAARLKPGGNYTDYHLGAEYVQRAFAAGLRWSDTSIDGSDIDPLALYQDRHYGSRLVAYLRFTP